MGQQPFPWEAFETLIPTSAPSVEPKPKVLSSLVTLVTERMRELYGIKIPKSEAINTSASDYASATAPSEATAHMPKVQGTVSPSGKKDESYMWRDTESLRLISEIHNDAFRQLQIIEPDAGVEQRNEIMAAVAASFFGNRSLVDPNFNVNSPQFALLKPIEQIINKTIVKYESLAERSRKDPNMLFQINRIATWRDSLHDQGLISDEVYNAIKNPSMNFTDDAVQNEATAITQMLWFNEPAWTENVVQKTTTSFGQGTKSLLGSINMQDIVEGTPNDIIDLLPLPDVTERNLIAQQREKAFFDKFGSTRNLKDGIELLLGPTYEDEDGINKATRDSFINMVKNYRNNLIMSNPMLTEEEIEERTFQYILSSQTPQMGAHPGDDMSPYQKIQEAEIVKIRNEKRKDARKDAFGKLDTDAKVQNAIKAFIEDPNNFGSGAAVDTATLNELTSQYRKLVIEADVTGMPVPDINVFMNEWDQQRTADGVPTLGQAVAAKYFGEYTKDETRLDKIRTNLNLGPDLPTDTRLFPTGDYGAVRQIDIEKQKLFAEDMSLLTTAAGRKWVDDQVRNKFAGHGMTPSGDLAEWSGTYRDPVTGEIKFAQGQDFVDNINNFDPITQYLFQRAGTAYNPGFVSPAEMFAMQRGIGTPSLPAGLFGSTGMDTRYTTKDGITPMKVENKKQVVDMDKVTTRQVPSGPWTPSPGYTPLSTLQPQTPFEQSSTYFDLGMDAIPSATPTTPSATPTTPFDDWSGILDAPPEQYTPDPRYRG